MDHPLVIEIKGPAGAGKTVLMEALADYLLEASPDSSITLQEEGAQTEYLTGPQLTDPARRIVKPMRIDIRTQVATRAALGLHGENRTHKPQPPKDDSEIFKEGDFFRLINGSKKRDIFVVAAVNIDFEFVIYAYGNYYKTAPFSEIALLTRPARKG